MNNRLRWTRFAPLMIGVLTLLVLGWTPMASAGRAEDRAARIAAQEEQKAAREAERAAKIAAREAERAAKQAAREAEQAAREAERAAKQAAREAEQAAREAERAAKKATRELLRGTDSQFIGPEGGRLMVRYLGGKGGKDNVQAKFIVPRNALAAPTEISMTLEVDTQDMSYVKLIFTPSGLKFDIPAILKIKLGKDMAELLGFQSMVGLHAKKRPKPVGGGDDDDDDGDDDDDDDDYEVDGEVPLTIEPEHYYVEVEMLVPGFSRYSLAGRR